MKDNEKRIYQNGKWMVIPPKHIREQILHEDIIRNSANGERDHEAFKRSIQLELLSSECPELSLLSAPLSFEEWKQLVLNKNKKAA